MNVLYISGSPRRLSNTDYLLRTTLTITGGHFIKLSDYKIRPCNGCWTCRKIGECTLGDDMSKVLMPMLFDCDAIVLGSPVYFNNVSAQMKTFMDRTWSCRGKLRNKIGGAVVVGRRYGAESAINAINAFFLKHEIIPANRGVTGIAFATNEIENDLEAIEAARRLGERILELRDMQQCAVKT